jgi:outer membrane protein OmpA-like peptidoglycan-associated protein
MPPNARLTVLLAATLAIAGCTMLPGRAPPPAEPAPAPAPAPAPPPPAAAPGITVLPSQDHQQARARMRQQLAASFVDPLTDDDAGYYMDVLHARLKQLGSEYLSIARSRDDILLSMPGRLSFEVGSARLDPGIRSTLVALADVLVDYQQLLITVHGHTDDSGPPEVNQRLSEQRALTVARQLQQAGIDRRRLLAVGHGPLQPRAGNDSEAGRETNRRVELQLELIGK